MKTILFLVVLASVISAGVYVAYPIFVNDKLAKDVTTMLRAAAENEPLIKPLHLIIAKVEVKQIYDTHYQAEITVLVDDDPRKTKLNFTYKDDKIAITTKMSIYEFVRSLRDCIYPRTLFDTVWCSMR